MTEPLVRWREGGERAPVFCIHPIGGHVTEYAGLVELIAPAHPLYAIRSRGPAAEPATLAAMAVDYAAVVQTVRPAGPVALVGWSLGAVVAHAIACELDEVALVAMIDPLLAVPAVADELRAAVMMAIQIFHPAPPPRPVIRSMLEELDEDDPAAWCLARGLVPAHVAHAELAGTLALFGKHRALLAAHRPGTCRAPLQVWRARGAAPFDWAAHTSAACTARQLAADHFTIMRAPHVAAIAADLNSALSAFA